VIAAGIGALIAAQLLGHAVNHFTGWKELQIVGSMDLAGKANKAILSLWHNPIWEEVVFRGIPLLGYTLLVKLRPGAMRAGRLCYFLVPSLVFAAYHVPGHGYSRITDTLVLALAFAWIALRYSFWSVVVLHCIFDALLVLSLGKLKNIPTGEIQWLADHFGALNSTFSLAVLAALAWAIVLLVRQGWQTRQPLAGGQETLTWIKVLHTAVWAFFAACIMYLPIAAFRHQFRVVLMLTALVLVECAVLACNRGHCPLTDIAARYTTSRADNFDIYLPVWLASHNKQIFGALFVVGEAMALWQWFAFT
jgi:hypothetical protein